MALLRNGTKLNECPLRQLGGGVHADISMFGRGDQRNIYSGITDKKSGIPNGHVAPSSWLLPLKPGGMSSVNYSVLKLVVVASGTLGAPIEGTASMEVSATGTGSLITSGEGSATFSISVGEAPLLASLSAVGSSEASVTGTGELSAVGWLEGSASMSFSQSASILPADSSSPLRTGSATMGFSATLTSYAIGSMTGSTLTGGAMSEATIIAAMNDNPPAVNLKKVNGIAVSGQGSSGSPWGPV